MKKMKPVVPKPKSRRKSKSDESLNQCLNRIPQRKASTPTHDRSTMSNSPDISSIMMNENRLETSRKQVMKSNKQLNSSLPRKTAVSEEINLEQELDFEYTRYIQTVFRKKLEEKKNSEIDTELTKLQKRIEENQRILHMTTSRLKNINFNKEVDFLHSLHSPNFAKVLETVNEGNCEERLTVLNQKLEQARHRLRVNKIEVPPTATLAEVVSDTVEALEKLKMNQDIETMKTLAELSKVKKATTNAILKTVNSLPVSEDLLLTKNTLEISAQDLLAQKSLSLDVETEQSHSEVQEQTRSLDVET
uniref:Uncharacterized protein n=1 Tax=Cuerna arida TaxID=1464854 RepID=A0A1B6G6I2_9HEMI